LGGNPGTLLSVVANRAASRINASTNDKADRLEKKGASQSKVAQARAEDAKLNSRRIPVGNKANTSRANKVGSVIKGAAEGAAGKNAAGKMAGGQVTGAIAGAAQALLSVTKRRTLLLLILSPILGILVEIGILFVVTSVVVGALAGQGTAASTQASVTTSELSQESTVAIQAAASNTTTPWELLAATVFYETGAGSSVSEVKGVCPKNSPPGAICPSVPAPTSTPGGHLPPATLVHSGFTPKVGMNGSVPRHLKSTSPDFVTTNTADWACIRASESGDVYGITSGAYGFVGTKAHPYTLGVYNVPGVTGPASKATPAEQNKVALVILNREGHFYGAWNDACTGSGGGTTHENTLSAIPPGVQVPATPGTATSYGATPLSVATTRGSLPAGGTGSTTTTASTTTIASTPTTTTVPKSVTTTSAIQTQKCPAKSSGPYCLTTTVPHTPGSPAALTTPQKVSLASSSRWVAQQLQAAFQGKGLYGPLDLSDGVTVPIKGTPYLNTSAATAIEEHAWGPAGPPIASGKASPTGSLATVPATVCDVAFRGRGYDHVVELSGGHRLTGIFHPNRIERGARVALSVDPAGCFAFPDTAPATAGIDVGEPVGRQDDVGGHSEDRLLALARRA